MDDRPDIISTSSSLRQQSEKLPPSHGPRNTSAETQALTFDVIKWFHQDRAHGSDCRVIRELVLGRRRIDLVFVYPSNIVGVEIKSSTDSLSDGRLKDQLIEFGYHLPEVWLAIDACWRDQPDVKYAPNLLVSSEAMVVNPRAGWMKAPHKDEMCCSRLLNVLWRSEALAIASRHNLVQVQLARKMNGHHVKQILARMLTGHEVMKEVCRELRSRQLTGIASDAPLPKPSRASSRQPELGLFSRSPATR